MSDIATAETSLYRMYDADGILLYVGISLSFPARFATHKSEKPWASEVANMTVEQYPTRQAALDAEAAAIIAENPVHNRQRPGVKRPRRHHRPSSDPKATAQRRWRAKKAREEGREPGKRGRPPTQPCGTVAAYKRHLRNDEEPCDACRAANSDYHRELYQRRKNRAKGTP